MSFKLSSLKASSVAVPVEITHPVTGDVLADDKGNKVVVHLFGKASKQRREYDDKRLKEVLDKQKKKGNALAQELTVEKVRDNEISAAVAMTSHIDTLVADDGTPYNTPEAIKALYEDEGYYWLFDQVKAELENDSNFI